MPAAANVATITRLKRTSSSTSLSSTPDFEAGPSRALRAARLLYYSIAAPTFLWSLYVQLVVLKAPGRVPIPASTRFGRDTVFLTFHGNFHCTWYACLCLLHAVLDMNPGRLRHRLRLRRGKHTQQQQQQQQQQQNQQKRPQSAVALAVERAAYKWTGILFPLASFVGIAYYLILHFHPLTRLRARAVPDYDEKMALLHLVPLLFVLGDSLLKDDDLARRHGMSERRSIRGIVAYGVAYFAWSCFCVFLNGGHWPYPFQTRFSATQHIAFVSTVLLVAQYLTRFGFRLQARLDRRRRRRLARAHAHAIALANTQCTAQIASR